MSAVTNLPNKICRAQHQPTVAAANTMQERDACDGVSCFAVTKSSPGATHDMHANLAAVTDDLSGDEQAVIDALDNLNGDVPQDAHENVVPAMREPAARVGTLCNEKSIQQAKQRAYGLRKQVKGLVAKVTRKPVAMAPKPCVGNSVREKSLVQPESSSSAARAAPPMKLPAKSLDRQLDRLAVLTGIPQPLVTAPSADDSRQRYDW